MPKRLVLVAGHNPRRAARRLRVIGIAVLVAGIAAAGLLYWLEIHLAEPTIEDLMPGTRAANARQMGLLYGHAVQSLWEILQELKEPAAQAVMLAAMAGLTALGCFRAATRRERPEQAR